LRQHLHLKLAELEPLLALSEATMARRAREQAALAIRWPLSGGWIG
jgi:hypothetical protein